MTNHIVLKYKTFGLFQKTKCHSNNFSLNGSRQTAVMMKLYTLEERIEKMKTCAYWYPVLKKNLKKNFYSDALMKRLMIELCFI